MRGSKTNFKGKRFFKRLPTGQIKYQRRTKKITFSLTFYPVFQNFKRRDRNETFNVLKRPLDCNSNHVIYLFECKQCQYRLPYVGSTKTKFRYRINNYKSTHRKFRKKYVEKDLAIVIKKSELKQKTFTNTTVQRVTKELNIGVSLSQTRFRIQTHLGKRNCIG